MSSFRAQVSAHGSLKAFGSKGKERIIPFSFSMACRFHILRFHRLHRSCSRIIKHQWHSNNAAHETTQLSSQTIIATMAAALLTSNFLPAEHSPKHSLLCNAHPLLSVPHEHNSARAMDFAVARLRAAVPPCPGRPAPPGPHHAPRPHGQRAGKPPCAPLRPGTGLLRLLWAW